MLPGLAPASSAISRIETALKPCVENSSSAALRMASRILGFRVIAFASLPSPLWEKVDRRREATASRMRGSLRETCPSREPLIRRLAPPSPTRGEGRTTPSAAHDRDHRSPTRVGLLYDCTKYQV